MDDPIGLMSSATAALTFLATAGRMLVTFIRALRQRRRARLWAPVVALAERVLDAVQATHTDVKQLSHKLDTSFRQTDTSVAELRNDVRNWSFQMFTLEALRKLLGISETQDDDENGGSLE